MKRNIVLIGMMGSGKSALGRRLAEELERSFVDVDDYIEVNWDSIPKLFEQGEEHFRDIESLAVGKVAESEGQVIATGGGVILRDRNMVKLKEKGIIYFIDRPLDQLLTDVDTTHRPLLKDGREKIITIYEERIDRYQDYADHIIVNDGTEEVGYQRLKEAIEEEQA